MPRVMVPWIRACSENDMTIKITRGNNCDPQQFEPYSLTIHIDNYEDHLAFKYLAMCNSRVPDALYKRAHEGFRGGKFQGRAEEIRCRTKTFLIDLVGKIPKRVDVSD